MASFPFPLLPVEIRLQIWEAHIESIPPRRITIRAQPAEAPPKPARYFSSAPIPSVLHTCSESRSVARKRWRETLGAFDPLLDTIVLATDDITIRFLDSLGESDMRILKPGISLDLNQEFARVAEFGSERWNDALEAVMGRFGRLPESKEV